jgi:hypothetical protein
VSESSRTARVQIGKNTYEWEILDEQGDLIAVRYSQELAMAFADGWTLAMRQAAARGE